MVNKLKHKLSKFTVEDAVVIGILFFIFMMLYLVAGHVI